ncbi:threonylcarbamoyl-AMP synthase [Candidatus Gottesmanbacteria bacterium]|nr:threonylcarbamoyl-AMP synthase [Candidatus Gottesmanbacteria bacterium]
MNTLPQAIQIIKNGGIVIFPTDTAFGIGCRMDDARAVDRLFALRRRPRTQATPVLVASADMALTYYTDPPQIVRHLMKKYWPGALTIIAPCRKNLVYSPIRGGTMTIGLRMPNHEIPRRLIEAVGVGLLGPSANFHGEPTPYRREDLDPSLVTLVDYVVEGNSTVGLASTVIDCSVNPNRIIRQGSCTIRDITVILDTSGSDAIQVAVEMLGGARHELHKSVKHFTAQEVLPILDELLKKLSLSFDDVAAVRVHTGPGSYTGLRVGAAIANTLGVLLDVSINGHPVGQTVSPTYQSDRYKS